MLSQKKCLVKLHDENDENFAATLFPKPSRTSGACYYESHALLAATSNGQSTKGCFFLGPSQMSSSNEDQASTSQSLSDASETPRKIRRMVRKINSALDMNQEPWAISSSSDLIAPVRVISKALENTGLQHDMKGLLKKLLSEVELDKKKSKALKKMVAALISSEPHDPSNSMAAMYWGRVRKEILESICRKYRVDMDVFKFEDDGWAFEKEAYPLVPDTEASRRLYFAERDGCMFQLYGTSTGDEGNSDEQMEAEAFSAPQIEVRSHEVETEGSDSDDDDDVEEVYDVSMPVYKTLGVPDDELPFGWVLCGGCKKWRAVDKFYYDDYNMPNAHFNCTMETGMHSENSCEDAPIWAKIFDFFSLSPLNTIDVGDGRAHCTVATDREGVAYRRMLRAIDVSLNDPGPNDHFVDISLLFLIVRSFGSLESASQDKIVWGKIVQDQLGLRGASSHLLRLKAAHLYESIFRTTGYDGNGTDDTLEVHLMKELKVRKTLVNKQEQILKELGVDESERALLQRTVAKNARDSRGLSEEEENWLQGESLPRLIDQSWNVYRSEHVETMLTFLVNRMNKLKKVLAHEDKADLLHRDIASFLVNIIAVASQVSQRSDDLERLKLLMVGLPRAGKSFTIDLCLRMSERDTNVYLVKAARVEDSDAVVDAQKIAAKPTRGYYHIKKIEASKEDLARYRNHAIKNAEDRSRQVYVDYHENIGTIVQDRRSILPFLLAQCKVRNSIYVCVLLPCFLPQNHTHRHIVLMCMFMPSLISHAIKL